ncbi:uncharacterized protein LOC126908907 isoform X2 [Daktulosphaira vitifoliae]|uniref:uncharacterized protein LOC126908907 isoform X2 n=1 Tax=Daktulosphaira vitifoliae TaxID=58002 RepID=UPI0021AABF9E|nr:uncharacterized protein LOC126908907 isoform X2 [Daktulosphaira vitifoliae]
MILLNQLIIVSFCLAFQVYDEKCEVCYESKPVVFLNPCLHRLCATCAFNAHYKNEQVCLVPSCRGYIKNYENINDNGLCYSCKEEASSVTIIPCFHKIGNSCAYEQICSKSKRCPQCYFSIPYFFKIKLINNVCQNCYNEIGVKIMKHCHHYIGKNCINKYKDHTKCPVKNCEKIQDHSLKNDSEKVCCICLIKRSLTVTLKPCYHKICNDCANELTVLNITECPLCRENIVYFNNIELIERCSCKKELRHVVLEPCLHKIGMNCAKYISNNNYQPKCPMCSENIEFFRTDEPHMSNLLNPSYLIRIKNLMRKYL